MDARERIIYALNKSSISRQALADKLGLGRGAVSARLNSTSEFDSYKYLKAAAELTGFRFDWLCTGEGPERADEQGAGVNEPSMKYKNELEQLRDENKRLKHENEVLLKALREIGQGQKAP